MNGTILVEKLQSGEKPVFEDLYTLFYPKLSFFSNQYLMDEEAAANIAQDVFTELWERRESLQQDSNIQAWLFTVTKNKSLKAIAREKTKQRYVDYLKVRQLETNYLALSDFETSHFVFDDLREKIGSALKMLSPSVRNVFEKSRFEGKKNKVIAEELGISIKTVEAHVSKALKVLRKELKDFLPLLYFLLK